MYVNLPYDWRFSGLQILKILMVKIKSRNYLYSASAGLTFHVDCESLLLVWCGIQCACVCVLCLSKDPAIYMHAYMHMHMHTYLHARTQAQTIAKTKGQSWKFLCTISSLIVCKKLCIQIFINDKLCILQSSLNFSYITLSSNA